MRKCKVKLNNRDKTIQHADATFHEWGLDMYDDEHPSYSVGICELPDGSVIMPAADLIVFTDEIEGE